MTENKTYLIVLGGSFNPLTMAHKALMEHARKYVGELFEKDVDGIYVPSSHNYVKRKMEKLPEDERLLFTEEERFYMLQGILTKGCSISTVEYGDDGRGHSYRTMQMIHGAYPNTEPLFLIGADKLKILPRWGNIRKFLNEFCFLVTSRDMNSAEALIEADEILADCRERFILIPELPDDYSTVSSTAARGAILKKDWTEVERLCGDNITGIIKKVMESR